MNVHVEDPAVEVVDAPGSPSLRHYACDLCQADEPKRIPFTKWHSGQALYACGRCGLMYLPDRRNFSELGMSFSEGFFESRPWTGVLTRARQLRAVLLLEGYTALTGKRLLDIGCGEGDLLVTARQRGASVIGVEPWAPAAKRAMQAGIHVHVGYFEEWASRQPSGSFDVITFVYVLETMPSPAAALEACWRLLSDRGVLLVSTGNRLDYKRFPVPLNRFLRKTPREFHPYNWSETTLEAMLNLRGFAVAQRDWRESERTLTYLARKTVPWALDGVVLDRASRLMWYFTRWHFTSYVFNVYEPFVRLLGLVRRAARRRLLGRTRDSGRSAPATPTS